MELCAIACFLRTLSKHHMALSATMRDPDPNRSMKWALFKTGTTTYSWPYPTHEAGPARIGLMKLGSDPIQPTMRVIFLTTGR